MKVDDSCDSSAPLETRYHSVSPLANETYEGSKAGDLSLSELSVNDVPGPSHSQRQRPFSLLARPLQRTPSPKEVQQEEEDAGNETMRQVEDEEARAQSIARSREERLRHDLFVLRKLNAGLSVYNEALDGAQSSTERVAEQLKQTNALLDKYVDILAKSETATKLIFDERWHGADDDEATLQRLKREAEEKARKAEEERARAEQEKERKEKEERERKEKEKEKERQEAEKRERLSRRVGYGGVRGVRGTRATARARGAAVSRMAGGASRRGRPSSIPTAAGGSGGRVPRPASSSSSRLPAPTTTRSSIR